MKNHNTNNLFNNLSWKFAERIIAQLVTLIVSVVLARILDPAHYGIIAIVMIYITVANVFVSDGFGNALIQKKDVDALDYSSVLYFNILFSIVLYVLLFFLAPFISAFYGEEGYELLTPVLRVLGFRLILSAVNSVQHAYVAKNMMFRKFFLATLMGTVLSAVVGVTMAYYGFGVWALVGQYLTNTTTDTIVLFFTLHKMPLLIFSFTRLKSMVKFGSQILATSLLIIGYQELKAIIIGKIYTSSDLAFYDRGKQIPGLIVNNINTSIGAVLFPKIANEQDSLDKVKKSTRNSIRFSAYLMSPMMLGLAALSESLVCLILTNKWLPCVPLLQLFCIVYLFQPIHTANMQAIKAIGKGDLIFKLELFKKTFELISFVIMSRISVRAIVISMAVLATAYSFVNAYPNKKLLNYTYKEQLSDILPSIGLSTFMFVCILGIGFLPIENLVLKLMLQILVGIAIYITLSIITQNAQLKYLISFLTLRTNKEL